MAVAASLVQYNVERHKKTLLLVGREKFAITLSPAIAVVLYAMTGTPTTLMSGRRAKEELVALFAVRQLMLASMTTFVNRTCGHERSVDNEQFYFQARTELDCSLEKIHLVSLDKPLDLAPNPLDQIFIPMVGTGTVLLHGNKAPFADIIAPFTFIQAKFNNTSSSILKVDLSLELRKCSKYHASAIVFSKCFRWME